LGAAEVVACDLDAGREEVARAFGATGFALPGNLPERVRPVSAGRGADLALELSGAGSGVATALDSVRIGGRVIIAGTVAPVGTVSIDPHQLLRRMIRIEGVHNYAPRDLVTAIDFLEVACNRFPFERLIGPRIPLGEIDTAFGSPSTACRCVVVPESSRKRMDLPKP
jgi:alcohol dehydrogenase